MPNLKHANGIIKRSLLASVFGTALMTAGAGVQPTLADSRSLRTLPIGHDVLRLAGEAQTHNFQVYLSPEAVRSPVTLQLAPTSSISVMPEASMMDVVVNGHALSPMRLGTDRAAALQSRVVSPHILRAGWNTVALTAQHRHRVDCTYPATFELWTDIDAQRSGFLVQDALGHTALPATPRLEDLLAWPLNEDGRHVLHGVLRPGASEDQAQNLSDGLAQVALALGAEAPVVSVSEAVRPGSISIALDAGVSGPSGAYELGFIDEALLITLHGASATEWIAAARNLANHLDATIEKPQHVGFRTIDGADRFTLADLGLASQEFAGRHFEQRFTLDMPLDYYPSDVGRVEIRLAGGYVADLAEHAELSVQVNGDIAASIPLDARRGEVFSERSIYLDLGHFRPGQNEVAITADVTHQSDAVCNVASLTDSTPRFLLLDETEISFPSFARLGALPRLAPGLGSHLVSRQGSTRLFIPHPDPFTVSSAVALRVRLALDVGALVPVDLEFTAPTSVSALRGRSNDILIGAFHDIPQQFAHMADLPVDELSMAWAPSLLVDPLFIADPIQTAAISRQASSGGPQPLPQALEFGSRQRTAWPQTAVERRIAALRQGLQTQQTAQNSWAVDPMTTASVGAAPVAQSAEVPEGSLVSSDDDALLKRWQNNVDQGPALLRSASELGAKLQDYVVGLAGEREHAPALSAEVDIVLQQVAVAEATGAPLTIITASEPARLEAGIQAISQGLYWNQLDGSRVAFSAQDGTMDVAQGLADPVFVVTQPTSVSNWRLVLAGYYSNNPLIYTLAILLIAPGLGVICGRAIRRSGQVDGGQLEDEPSNA